MSNCKIISFYLLDKTTVITAAHCIATEINYLDSNGDQAIIPITTTNEFPTFGSMYKVFLGVQNFLLIFTVLR